MYRMLGSVACVLSILFFGTGSTLSVEDRLNILEEKLVEKDNEIKRLTSMVEAIGQKEMFQTPMRDFNIDGSTIKNSTMEISTNKSERSEYDYRTVIEDIALNVNQSGALRSSPGTVAFYAYLSASRCYHDYETIVFDREVTDISGSYNAHDGIFDVPVTGIYIISVTIGAMQYRWVSVEIVSNAGKVLGATLADSEDLDSHPSGSITFPVHLQAGEHVLVRRKTANGSCAIYSKDILFTSFSVWLLA